MQFQLALVLLLGCCGPKVFVVASSSDYNNSPFPSSLSLSRDDLYTCSSLLQADGYDSISSSRSRARIQVDQVDDDPLSFGSGSSSRQNDENENGENKVYNSRSHRSIHSLQHHLSSTTIPSTPFQVSSGNHNDLDGQEDGSSFLNSKIKIHHLKTGTTIAGCCLESGYVILGADTRATAGSYVADKRCEKLHKVASNIYAAGAGTSADLDALTRLAHYSMALEQLVYGDSSIGNANTNINASPIDKNDNNDDDDDPLVGMSSAPVSVEATCRMMQDILYDGKGEIGANLILGGVYQRKPYLRAIHPHGSMDVNLPYTALGSGGLAAMGVLESRYQPNISLADAKQLVMDAIVAGIRNDLGSGSQVDLCVLNPDGTSEYTRCVVAEETLLQEQRSDEKQKEQQDDDDDDDAGTNNLGVNGFGNLAFAVKSKRVLRVSDTERKRLHDQKWEELLSQ